MVGDAGSNEMGSIHQRYLESSNVEIVEEMVNMIIAQRGYEVNSKSVNTADRMLETAIGLKR
jgi:flagellar basal-body rod protein FlgG